VEWLWVIVLGVVQGVAEFLPISSSGHLAVMQEWLGMEGPRLLMNVALHAGTFVSILVVYRTDLLETGRGGLRAAGGLARRRPVEDHDRAALSTILAVGVATLVTLPVALLLRDRVEILGEDLAAVGGFFLITALVLAGTWVTGKGRRRVGWAMALGIGLAQGLAVLPGISRSGVTIVAALLMGARRDEAVRFSFLAALPVLLGAIVLEGGLEGAEIGRLWPMYLAGALTSAVVGWICLKVLIRVTVSNGLPFFALYLVPLGLVLMLM